MPRKSSNSLDMGSVHYSKCTVTFLRTSDTNSQIGEFGLFLDQTKPYNSSDAIIQTAIK